MISHEIVGLDVGFFVTLLSFEKNMTNDLGFVFLIWSGRGDGVTNFSDAVSREILVWLIENRLKPPTKISLSPGIKYLVAIADFEEGT